MVYQILHPPNFLFDTHQVMTGHRVLLIIYCEDNNFRALAFTTNLRLCEPLRSRMHMQGHVSHCIKYTNLHFVSHLAIKVYAKGCLMSRSLHKVDFESLIATQ